MLINKLNVQFNALQELADNACVDFARAETKKEFITKEGKYTEKILEGYTELFIALEEKVRKINKAVESIRSICQNVEEANKTIGAKKEILSNFLINLYTLFRSVPAYIALDDDNNIRVDLEKKRGELIDQERKYIAQIVQLNNIVKDQRVLIQKWNEQVGLLTSLVSECSVIKKNIQNFELVFKAVSLEPKLLVDFNRFQLFSGSELSSYGPDILTEPEIMSFSEDKNIAARFRELKIEIDVFISNLKGAQDDSLSEGEKRAQRRLICALAILVDEKRSVRGRTIRVVWKDILGYVFGIQNIDEKAVSKMEELAFQVSSENKDDPQALLLRKTDSWGRPFVFYSPTPRGRQFAKKWEEFNDREKQKIEERKKTLDQEKALAAKDRRKQKKRK